MIDIMGQGTVGVLIVTSLLFIIWLIRMGAGSKAHGLPMAMPCSPGPLGLFSYRRLSHHSWARASVLPLAVIGLTVLVDTVLGGRLSFGALARNWSYPKRASNSSLTLRALWGAGIRCSR